MNYRTLKVQIMDNVAIVTLNRTHKKNAMSFLMMRELIHIAKRLKKSKNIRATILTGVDDFCSGLDVSQINQAKHLAFVAYELIKPNQSLFQKTCLIWRDLPMPVIACIDGVCFGAGLQLALAADIRMSTCLAHFSILEGKWGLVADMGLSQSALGVLSVDKLKELAMTARIIDANTAKEFGLVGYVFDDEKMMSQHAWQLIDEIKQRSPDAVLAAKRLINTMHAQSPYQLYREKFWQLQLLCGYNHRLAIKKTKDATIQFVRRQFR